MKIKELAIEAGLIAPYGSDREGLRDFDYRQFAELIIKECLSCAIWVGAVNEHLSLPRDIAHTINKRIVKKFGLDNE